MLIIEFGILFCYLHVAALGTTDILRLLKGCEISVFTFNSVCDNCGHKLNLLSQIPIISYIKNKGRCKYCKSKIDIKNFWLELFPFIYYCAINIFLDFSFMSVAVNFFSYEILKLFFIFIKGSKEKNFIKEYILSLFSNAFLFFLILILVLLNGSFNL